jgi:hypothetical protein
MKCGKLTLLSLLAGTLMTLPVTLAQQDFGPGAVEIVPSVAVLDDQEWDWSDEWEPIPQIAPVPSQDPWSDDFEGGSSLRLQTENSQVDIVPDEGDSGWVTIAPSQRQPWDWAPDVSSETEQSYVQPDNELQYGYAVPPDQQYDDSGPTPRLIPSTQPGDRALRSPYRPQQLLRYRGNYWTDTDQYDQEKSFVDWWDG